MNQITLIGHVGRAPELTYLPSGTAKTTFTLATTYRRKEAEDETTWHNCVAFGKAAETLSQYVGKGSKLFVQGRLQKRPYTNQAGDKREWIEVLVQTFEFLNIKNAPDHEAEAEAIAEAESEVPF